MAPSPRHTPEASALTDLIVEVFRVNGSFLSAGDRMTGTVGQSSARWQVLSALREEDATVSQVARTMGLTRQSVQRIADLLVADGLAELSANPAHRRSPLVALTKRGRAVLGRIESGQILWSNEVASGISERRLRAAVSVLRELRERLQPR